MNALPAVIQPVAIGCLAYLALILTLRTAGRRTMSKWNAFDSVLTIALGSVLASTFTAKPVRILRKRRKRQENGEDHQRHEKARKEAHEAIEKPREAGNSLIEQHSLLTR